MRLTALDVLTNMPISPPLSIETYIDSDGPVNVTSHGIIPNVPLGSFISAIGHDNNHLFGAVYTLAKDIFNDGIMDVTLVLSPPLVKISSVKKFSPSGKHSFTIKASNQMRIVLMWGEGDINFDLHGLQYNFTGKFWYKVRRFIT